MCVSSTRTRCRIARRSRSLPRSSSTICCSSAVISDDHAAVSLLPDSVLLCSVATWSDSSAYLCFHERSSCVRRRLERCGGARRSASSDGRASAGASARCRGGLFGGVARAGECGSRACCGGSGDCSVGCSSRFGDSRRSRSGSRSGDGQNERRGFGAAGDLCGVRSAAPRLNGDFFGDGLPRAASSASDGRCRGGLAGERGVCCGAESPRMNARRVSVNGSAIWSKSNMSYDSAPSASFGPRRASPGVRAGTAGAFDGPLAAGASRVTPRSTELPTSLVCMTAELTSRDSSTSTGSARVGELRPESVYRDIRRDAVGVRMEVLARACHVTFVPSLPQCR